MRTVLVLSVRSKQRTPAPLLGMVRLVTATTSPSTQTLPDSRLSVRISMGLCLMARPIRTLPALFFAPGAASAWEGAALCRG